MKVRLKKSSIVLEQPKSTLIRLESHYDRTFWWPSKFCSNYDEDHFVIWGKEWWRVEVFQDVVGRDNRSVLFDEYTMKDLFKKEEKQ